MDLFTTQAGLDFLARWGHFLAGITWIGLLYYFNLVQTEYFKVADAPARTDAFVKLVPNALWWFRWGAMLTFLTGLVLLGFRGALLTIDITLGAVLGTIMFLNVWLIIWPNQRIVIASNEKVKAGEAALPEAAAAAPKAGIASRTNFMFSVPMLYFMGSSAHFSSGQLSNEGAVSLILSLVVIAALEANALFRTAQGPLTTVNGAIGCGFALWLVLYGIIQFL